MDAGVLAERPAIGSDDLAASGGRRCPLLSQIRLHEGGVVAIRDEADLLAVLLLGDRQSQTARDLPDLALVHLADRKQSPRKLRLRQSEEEIGLVLAPIHALAKLIAPGLRVAGYAGIVPRRNLRRADRIGHLEKLIPHEWRDHLLLESLLEIDHVIGNA